MELPKDVSRAETRSVGVFGLSHKSASLKELGRCSLRDLGSTDALKHFSNFFDEVVVLATCNRIELYFVGKKSLSRRRLMSSLRQCMARHSPHTDTSGFYVRFGREAVRHLYAVASGIDSMVIGETDILAQIGQARRSGLEKKTCGALLDGLFMKAEKFGKDVRKNIAISRGVTSVTDLAVNYVEELSLDPRSARLLIIGAGHISSVVALRLAERSPQKICIVSRTRKKALALRAGVSAASPLTEVSVMPRSSLRECLRQADVVIAAATATAYLIRPADLSPSRKNIVFLDLGVPANIDPSIADAPRNVRVVTMDDFVRLAGGILRRRKKLIPLVRREILAAAL